MDVIEVTEESIRAAKTAQARDRADFEAATGTKLASDGSIILDAWVEDALAAVGLVLIVLALCVCC